MERHIGLWIDHRQAVLVTITDKEEETQRLMSNMEKHVRFSSDPSEGGSAEDMRDRQFDNHLDEYYDRVVVLLRDAAAIQIFGPGEAKGELAKRLERDGIAGRIVSIEAMDKMTDGQISAKVREHCRLQS